MFGRGTHGELVHVGLAHHHDAYLIEAFHDCSIIWWLEVFQHTRAAGSGDVFGADHVFDRDRNACQREETFSTGETAIRFLCLLQGQFVGYEGKGTYLWLNGADTFKMRFRQFDRRDFLLT